MADNEKIKQLERELEAQGIDTLLILSREDSDIVLPLLLPVHVVAQTALLFNRDGHHVVLTGSTDANMYKEFGIFEIQSVREDFETELKALLDNIDPHVLALNISESDHLCDGLTAGQYQMLENVLGTERLAKMETSSEQVIKRLRGIKSEHEISLIRHAVEVTCRIYAEVHPLITVGMSETDIGDLFVTAMKRHKVVNAFGAPYSYPLICINRCGLAHREPQATNILKPGDILIIDFSVSYQGYCSDIARSFYVLDEGEQEAPKEILRAFETTIDAVCAVIGGIRAGMTGYEADAIGRSVIEGAGYPTIRHSVGHQLGMRVHDGGTSLSPKTNPNSAGVIQAGEVYAIEPTVIQDDLLPSFIVEENIVIREQSIEILSERQQQLLYING